MNRPKLSEDTRRCMMIRMRATRAELEKFKRLGGVEWLRDMLKRARLPKP